MGKFSFKQIRLRPGVSTAFILLVVPLIVILVSFVYSTSARLALAQADRDMARLTQDIVDDVDSLLNPVARVVESISMQARLNQAQMRRTDGLRFFLDQVENLPQLESLYLGFDRDGSFYQAVRLAGVKAYGPKMLPPLPEANYVVRMLDYTSGQRADNYLYMAKWGDIVRVERGPAPYDPRPRIWYKGAFASKDTVISDVTVFASSGTVGLTISRRVESDEGVAIGAVGANISLARLSAFLEEKKIGKRGRVFIIDGDGNLVAHPSPTIGVRVVDKNVELLKATDIDDPVVSDAVHRRQQGAGNFFSASLGNENSTFRVSFAPFPERFSKKWTIGVVVEEDEFIGPLKRLSIQFVAMGGGIILVSILAILWLSHRLTHPLSIIVRETENIREFNLEGEMTVSSRITEVIELAEAVRAMKRSLRSFGAYVPKALVRNIVAAQGTPTVGGERQFLSIMFTDIQGFTKHSEPLPPEQVAENLSRYFREMSKTVHDHRGVIDKYIGDAIMAIWNAPVPDPDHVANACRAMLACRAVSARIDRDNRHFGAIPVFTRFGLHCGPMMVGNVGSEDRMQFTVLGGAVNLASRLEGMNKYYGTQLMVSQDVRAAVGDGFLFRWVDRVAPSGVSVPLDIYELVGELAPNSPLAPSPEDVERVALWEGVAEAFAQRNWSECLDLLQAFLGRWPADGPGNALLTRVSLFVESPPAADWDGANRYNEK